MGERVCHLPGRSSETTAAVVAFDGAVRELPSVCVGSSCGVRAIPLNAIMSECARVVVPLANEPEVRQVPEPTRPPPQLTMPIMIVRKSDLWQRADELSKEIAQTSGLEWLRDAARIAGRVLKVCAERSDRKRL